ncbi:MAG: hypothetical protein F4X64_09475 [Chloroflexi bacterium]|nr:hypothetical protein [Chloroflexota bacterium]
MTTTIDQLSDKAQELLTAALAVDGPAKGLISLSPAMGAGERLVVGNQYEVLFGDDAVQAQMAFYELADRRLIVEVTTGGYMVSPLGCQAAGWNSG